MSIADSMSVCVSQDLARRTEPRPPQDSGSAAKSLLFFFFVPGEEKFSCLLTVEETQ